MASAIDIQGIGKTFDVLKAVDNLSFSVNHGEMFGIVGPDGAGKTTLLRMLCGLLSPTSGSATILGFSLTTQSTQIKRNIGYLSQRFSLYGDLTIDENIEFFAEINEVYDFQDRRNELLEFTRLMPFRSRLAEQLSGGMKQKLALACTLIHHPKIIFLDEPTTGVDPVSRRDFWKILSDLLHSGITIVMTTPYLDEAERCHRVAMMNKGSLMVVDTPQKIKSLMQGIIVEVTCENVRGVANILKQSGMFIDVQTFGDRAHVVIDHERSIDSLEKMLSDAGVVSSGIRVISPTLENVFISLTTREPVPQHV